MLAYFLVILVLLFIYELLKLRFIWTDFAQKRDSHMA